MMHSIIIEYDELGTISADLNKKQKSLLIDLVYQYCMDSKKDPCAPIPECDDLKVYRHVLAICNRAQMCTLKHSKRSKTNKDNINKRWNKEKKSTSKPKSDSDEPEKPPMGGPEFTDMAHNLAKSLGIKDFNKKDAANLFITLYKCNWTYHGHSLKPCSHECSNGKTCNEKSLSERYCGLYGLMYYNLFAGSKLRELFNKLIDASDLDSICDVFKIMDNVELDGDQFVYTNLENDKLIFQFGKDVIGKAIEDYA